MDLGDLQWPAVALGAVSAVIVGLITAVAYKLAGKWLMKAAERGVAVIFGQLIATRAARRFALNRYRRRLATRYQGLENPFVPEGETVKVGDVYIPLEAEGVEGRATAADAYHLIRQTRRAIVTGPPGAGKTLLLRHAMLTWAQADPKRTSRQPIPVLCELKRFGESDLDVETQIVTQLERDGFSRAGRFVRRALRRGELSLFLDGLDEVASSERPRVAGLIRDFAEHADHEGVQIVVTSRTAVYAGQLEPQFSAKFRLSEFNDQLILRFLRHWPRLTHPEDAERLWSALRETPRLLALARSPLLLSMIAFLYCESGQGQGQRALPHSRVDFYKEVCLELLERRKRELSLNTFQYAEKKRVLQRLALTAMDLPDATADRLELSYPDLLSTISAALPDLNRSPEDAGPILTEIIERSGLLRPLDEGERYHFPHFTLQEYLAAEELADDPDGLLKRWRADPSRWRETVRLWCGSTTRGATAVVEEIYLTDKLLAFQCLTEANELDQELVEDIVRERLLRLSSPFRSPDLDELIAAFGHVASDRRPRGRAVFAALQELARDTERTSRPELAALAATNLPEAADFLATMPDDAAHWALVRMGELAVAPLNRAAERGAIWAVDGLATVGTRSAITALGNLLWGQAPSESVEFRAAWHLAARFDDLGVQAALRAVHSVSEDPGWRWVWEPFRTADDACLPAVAGRVVQLLTHDNAAGHRPNPPEPVAAVLAIPAACALDIELAFDIELPFPRAEDILRLMEGRDRVTSTAEAIDERLPPTRRTTVLRSILHGVAPEPRHWVLRSLVRPTPDRLRHWRDLFRGTVAYTFDRSWHYRTILALCMIVSTVALARTVSTVTETWPWGPLWMAWVGGFSIIVTWIMGLSAEVLTVSETLADGFSAPPVLVKAVRDRDLAEVVLRSVPTVGLAAITTYGFVTLRDLLTLAGAIATVTGLFAVAGVIVLLALRRIRLWENPLRMALDTAEAERKAKSVLAATFVD